MNLPALAGAAYARVNWSRWIVDCPSPWCDSALDADPGERFFQCRECGTGADIVWPPNVDDIEYLLAMRPAAKTRNWAPGETVADLLQENVLHGIDPPTVPGLPRHVAFAVRGDRVEKLALAPAADAVRLAITGGFSR